MTKWLTYFYTQFKSVVEYTLIILKMYFMLVCFTCYIIRVKPIFTFCLIYNHGSFSGYI